MSEAKTIRHFTSYQLNYLKTMYRFSEADKGIKTEIMNIGRIDETGEMILEYIQFGKVNKISVHPDPPEYK